MTDNWPPPQSREPVPTWPAPQGPPAPQYPQQYSPPPYTFNGPTTTDDKLLEWAIPINRSGLAIAAGYVALFTLPVLFLGPVAVLLGILAIRHLRNNPGQRGWGRAIFAIVYGGIGTLLLIWLVVYYATFR